MMSAVILAIVSWLLTEGVEAYTYLLDNKMISKKGYILKPDKLEVYHEVLSNNTGGFHLSKLNFVPVINLVNRIVILGDHIKNSDEIVDDLIRNNAVDKLTDNEKNAFDSKDSIIIATTLQSLKSKREKNTFDIEVNNNKYIVSKEPTIYEDGGIDYLINAEVDPNVLIDDVSEEIGSLYKEYLDVLTDLSNVKDNLELNGKSKEELIQYLLNLYNLLDYVSVQLKYERKKRIK